MTRVAFAKEPGHEIPLFRNPGLPEGLIRVYWLGQAGFLLETGHLRILIDPYLSDALAIKYQGSAFPHRRLMEPPVSPQDLHDIDLVLITHRHGDHMDPSTLLPLEEANPLCRFVVPKPAALLAQGFGLPAGSIELAQAGKTMDFGDGCSVTPIPAAHEDLVQDEKGDHLYLGYVVRLEGVAIYHSGDCCPYPGLDGEIRRHRTSVALLPVNGRDELRSSHGVPGNFHLSEALDFVTHNSVQIVLGHHFGMFDFNTICPREAQRQISGTGPSVSGRFHLVALREHYEIKRG